MCPAASTTQGALIGGKIMLVFGDIGMPLSKTVLLMVAFLSWWVCCLGGFCGLKQCSHSAQGPGRLCLLQTGLPSGYCIPLQVQISLAKIFRIKPLSSSLNTSLYIDILHTGILRVQSYIHLLWSKLHWPQWDLILSHYAEDHDAKLPASLYLTAAQFMYKLYIRIEDMTLWVLL